MYFVGLLLISSRPLFLCRPIMIPLSSDSLRLVYAPMRCVAHHSQDALTDINAPNHATLPESSHRIWQTSPEVLYTGSRSVACHCLTLQDILGGQWVSSVAEGTLSTYLRR